MTINNIIEDLKTISESIRSQEHDPGIIVFAPDKQFDYSYWEVISQNGFDVFIFETQEEVLQLLSERPIETIYIRSNERIKHHSFVSQLCKINKNVTIVFFTSIKEIFLSNSNAISQLNILKDNFNLMNSMFANEDKQTFDHTIQVVKYTELLCDCLQIPEAKKVMVIAAAYVHSFSILLMDNTVKYKSEIDIIKLSSQCLKTLNYTPEICRILDLMNIDIENSKKYSDEFLLANILTATDFFCHSKFNKQKITPEEFKQLYEFIHIKAGSRLFPEVAQELFNLLYDTIEISQTTEHSCHVVIYNESGKDQLMLESCLDNLGFNATLLSTIDELRASFTNDKIDILVIEAAGTVLQVSDLVNKIEDSNIYFENVTTYILANKESVYELTGLLQKGIEDIFNAENDLDPFLIKIIRAKNRISDKSNNKVVALEQMGTFGKLADMNLIVLLQTMNIKGKTCLLNITAYSNQLSIYVHDGIIAYAEDDETKGKNAIFKGLKWSKGIWNVDPISKEEFPSPNIDQPINSILLEGCQFMDETQNVDFNNLDADLDKTFDFLE